MHIYIPVSIYVLKRNAKVHNPKGRHSEFVKNYGILNHSSNTYISFIQQWQLKKKLK